jgi:hypothetical protein
MSGDRPDRHRDVLRERRARFDGCRPRPPATTSPPNPPDAFAAVTAITKLTGLFGQRCTP